jgi:hypothetical protein
MTASLAVGTGQQPRQLDARLKAFDGVFEPDIHGIMEVFPLPGFGLSPGARSSSKDALKEVGK